MTFDNKILKDLEALAESNLRKAESMIAFVEDPSIRSILTDALNKAKKGEVDLGAFLKAIEKARSNA